MSTQMFLDSIATTAVSCLGIVLSFLRIVYILDSPTVAFYLRQSQDTLANNACVEVLVGSHILDDDSIHAAFFEH